MPSQPRIPSAPGTYHTPFGEVTDPYHALRFLDEKSLDQVFTAEADHLASRQETWSNRAGRYYLHSRELLEEPLTVNWPQRHEKEWAYNTIRAGESHGRLHLAPGQQSASQVRVDALGERIAAHRLLLDLETLAASRSRDSYQIGSWDLLEGLFVYTECVDGSELYGIVVRDIDTGEERRGPAVVAADIAIVAGKVLYVTHDVTQRPHSLHLWDPSSDTSWELHREDNTRLELAFSLSSSRRHLVVRTSGIASGTSQLHDVTVEKNDDGTTEVTFPLVARCDFEEGVEITIIAEDDMVIVQRDDINGSSALYQIEEKNGPMNLLIESDLQIIDICTDGTDVFYTLRRGVGLTSWVLRPGEKPRPIEVPEKGSVSIESIDPTNGDVVLRLESWTEPSSLWGYDRESGLTSLFHREHPGELNCGRYVASEVMISARDMVEVPVTIVHRADLTLSQTPALVYVYGAYGMAMDPWWSPTRDRLLDDGAAFIIVHARGGGEQGRAWHDAGRKENKLNTFYDVVDVVEVLRAQGLIGEIVLRGGSAGGGTVASVVNMVPEIASGVVTEVPFVDACATMSDPSLPLTLGEYDEWGDPTTAEGFSMIRRWSAVDNVKPGQRYPATLVVVGENDPRVGFWEGLKYTARIRDAHADNDVLVRVERGTGHGGATGWWEAVRNECDTVAWVAETLGL
jgi:oligopeptidase B